MSLQTKLSSVTGGEGAVLTNISEFSIPLSHISAPNLPVAVPPALDGVIPRQWWEAIMDHVDKNCVSMTAIEILALLQALREGISHAELHPDSIQFDAAGIDDAHSGRGLGDMVQQLFSRMKLPSRHKWPLPGGGFERVDRGVDSARFVIPILTGIAHRIRWWLNRTMWQEEQHAGGGAAAVDEDSDDEDTVPMEIEEVD